VWYERIRFSILRLHGIIPGEFGDLKDDDIETFHREHCGCIATSRPTTNDEDLSFEGLY
jgi:hypothetical protein